MPKGRGGKRRLDQGRALRVWALGWVWESRQRNWFVGAHCFGRFSASGVERPG